MVVVSWVDGEASMVWLQRDPETGEYGLRYLTAIDEEGQELIETVVRPFDDPDHGCDWSAVKPAWITDHGTVIVLLGNSPTDDTALGDPNRDEAAVHGVVKYLNTRVWEIPAGVEVGVDNFRSDTKSKWPRNEREARSDEARGNHRRIVPGAQHWILYPEGHKGGKLSDSGIVSLKDRTKVRWYLWSG